MSALSPESNFLYDGDALVAEYDGSGHVLRRYAHGPGVDNPYIWFEGSGVTAAAARYLVADRQGSIIGYTDSTGKVPAGAVYTYDAYGAPSAWSGSRFRYTGQIEIPEAQLYYYKARMYDPVSGRFLQTDPVGYAAGLNMYGYVDDDPTDRGDPSGLCPTGQKSKTDDVLKKAKPNNNSGGGTKCTVRVHSLTIDPEFAKNASNVVSDASTAAGAAGTVFHMPGMERAAGPVGNLADLSAAAAGVESRVSNGEQRNLATWQEYGSLASGFSAALVGTKIVQIYEATTFEIAALPVAMGKYAKDRFDFTAETTKQVSQVLAKTYIDLERNSIPTGIHRIVYNPFGG